MKRLLALVIIVALAAQIGPAMAAGNAPSPPQSSAFGKPLAEWMRLHTMWQYGAFPDDHVGHVYFLPLPNGAYAGGSWIPSDPAILVGHKDVEFKPGSAFVLPVSGWLGETYLPAAGIPDDTMFDKSIFTNSIAWVKIDGRTVFDSRNGDVGNYYFTTEFTPPIMYAEPTYYDSTGIIWLQGLGFVHPPLSVGKHSIELHSELLLNPEPPLLLSLYPEGIGIVYENSWTITIKP